MAEEKQFCFNIRMRSGVSWSHFFVNNVVLYLGILYLCRRNKIITSMEQEEYDKITHSWDNYQLSEEVISMAPKERKKVYGDYNTELTLILEEKYK